MKPKVFIDGEAGTTGLQIKSRLKGREDIELLALADKDRKVIAHRREMLNAADIVILCLPDDASRKAVELINNSKTCVIDASTAHRTADGWVYGFPEYKPGQREKIAAARRVSNPGCYAITSVAILYPLIKAGLIPPNYPVTINAISGYSGGGKKLIATFEDINSANYTEAPFFAYSLTLDHKHLPEITRWSGLSHAPVFVPSVGRYPQGMIVQIPLTLWSIPGTPSAAELHATLDSFYSGQSCVNIEPLPSGEKILRIEPKRLNNTDKLQLYIFSNNDNEHAVVMGVIDNLGKGASGQAVQNMNIMLGFEENVGLTI
ncbi:MAG: N-acetyl-gamma-glutamyl-phosphate reductase [Rhodospirillaceae bacterium TMED8]|nr:N-acetyl-gamma-glutamyl-phosphate reductase [Magnetovibrio sp.]OUT51541.1 MAG: N-acetyl-gamma-glutamyl-phosphate reductase [Rhodospirillaceae bacterium TMED8]|tara:strand:+ start:108 stop:1061 length:954 start_codon:yes stop_codon:yes gene_type:complete